MERLKDYYSILGVPEDADVIKIKLKYRELAKQFHPDVSRMDPQRAKEKFIEINEAYHVLIDPEKRKAYDYLRKHGKPDSDLWKRFEKDVANIQEFILLLYEIQKYYAFKMASSGVGGGVGAGTGAYLGWKAGGILGAIAGGIIGGILGMFGGSKMVDLLDGGRASEIEV